MLSRDHLVILSWDPRWKQLTADHLVILLDHDDLPIVNELELLSMTERWNSDRDKKHEDVLKVCQCFRQSPENIGGLATYLSTLGRMGRWVFLGEVVFLRGMGKWRGNCVSSVFKSACIKIKKVIISNNFRNW